MKYQVGYLYLYGEPYIKKTKAKPCDNKYHKEYMNKSFSFIMMIAFPLMFGIISIAYKSVFFK